MTGATIPADLARGLRTTAAHSTLTLGDSNSTAILANGSLGKGVTEVELDRRETPPGSRLEMSPDGYARRHGRIHRPPLNLQPNGRALRAGGLQAGQAWWRGGGGRKGENTGGA